SFVRRARLQVRPLLGQADASERMPQSVPRVGPVRSARRPSGGHEFEDIQEEKIMKCVWRAMVGLLFSSRAGAKAPRGIPRAKGRIALALLAVLAAVQWFGQQALGDPIAIDKKARTLFGFSTTGAYNPLDIYATKNGWGIVFLESQKPTHPLKSPGETLYNN